MNEATFLPAEWQELQEVQDLLEQARREARAPLVSERDTLRRDLQQLQSELQQLRQTVAQSQDSNREQDKNRNGNPLQNGNNDQAATQDVQRLEALVARLQERIKTLEGELELKNKRLAEEVLERGIREAVAKVGEVHKDAWSDVVARGKALFTIDEHGRPVARDQAGNMVYGRDGMTPLDFAEWAGSLLAEAPHLFKASSGSGSTGGNGANGAPGGEQGPRPVVITREQARNPIHYRRAKDKAAKLGSELLIQ